MVKGNYLKNAIKKSALFVVLLVLIFSSAIFGFALSNNISDQTAYAITPTYTQNGGNVQSVNRTANPLVYTQDNALTLLGRQGSNYGDFAREGTGYPIIVGSEETGDENGYLRINELSPNLKLVAYIGIDASSEFAQAIQDELVVVRIIPFFVYADPTYMDGEDSCDYTVTYYSGEIDETPEIPTPVSYSNRYTNYFGLEDKNNPNAKKTAGSLIIPTKFVAANNPYIKIEMSNFQKTGFDFSIAVKSMGFTVSYSAETNVAIEGNEAQISVDNLDGNRDVNAESNMVKPADVICISTFIQKGSNKLSLNQTSDASGSIAAGKFYRKLFLTDASSGYTIINYDFPSNQLTRIYNYQSHGTTHDISTNFSGEKAYFRVLPSTRVTINITAMLWRYDGEPMGIERTFTYYLDGSPANGPQLDSTSTFYKKYIDNQEYFTNKTTYLTESVPVGDGSFVTKIKAVDLSLSDVKPQLSPESMVLRGGDKAAGVAASAQVVYYKVRRLAEDEDIPTYGMASDGFEKNEADGIYFTIFDDGTLYYSDLVLPLKQTVGGETVYYERGDYAIEFTTYDYVGNKAIGNIVYFVRVDVADYAFTYKYQLGDGTTVDKQVSTSDVTLSFATLLDSGKLSPYVSQPVFKRGDKVSIMARFTGTGYRAFILTYFSTTSVGMSTTDSSTTSWNGYNMSIFQNEQLYAFEVNTMFSENPSARQLKFIFKQKAEIDTTNTEQVYDGTGKTLKAQLRIDGSTVVSGINIAISYSTDNVVFSTTLPVNAGSYYYRSELLNHSRYYGIRTGTFIIMQANPNINSVAVSAIEYGESLSVIDFDENVYMTENGLSQRMSSDIICYNFSDAKYYYYKSADNIVGYFRVSGMEKTSTNYIKPPAGNLTITVQFCAIKYTYGAGNTLIFSTTPQGMFIRDENYALVSRTIVIKINNCTDVANNVTGISEDGKVYTDYDGGPKPLAFSLLSTLTSEAGLNLTEFAQIKYKNITNGEGEYTLDIPSVSGRYLVNVTINQARCNYKGTWETELIIKKKALNVESSDIVCLYQAERNPTAIASLGSGLDKVVYNGLKFAYTYYYYNPALGSYNEMATEDNLVEADKLFDKVPENAGVYVAKVTLDELNFENTFDVFVKLTVKKVATGNTRLSISYPTIGFNVNNLDSHIMYLQPLSQVAISSNWNVRYTYHVYRNNRLTETVLPVSGRFVVVTRMYDGLDRLGNIQTKEQYVTEMENYDQSTTGAKLMYLCFIPSNENTNNFDFLYKESEVVIGKAKPDFTNVTIWDIVYGTQINTIEDLTVNYAVRVLKVGTGAGAEYYELGGDYRYTLSLANITPTNPRMFEAGSHFVDITFMPKDTDSFETVTTSRTISVLKRNLSVELGTEKYDSFLGGYVHTYKGYTNPSITFGNKVESSHEVSGEYKFYKTSDGELYSVDELNVGRYRVYYSVLHPNYDGSAFFYCYIVKDTLTPSQTPSIFEESTAVSYNRLLKNVVFSNGIMRSTNKNEQIAGTYRLQAGDDERFLDTGIRKQYSLEFFPTDSQNYEPYGLDGSYKIYLTVEKADISTGLEIFVHSTIYGELDYNFNYADKIDYTTPGLWTDGVNYAGSKLNDNYHYLNADIAINNLPSSGKINAGSYRVTVNIVDDNYKGAKVGFLVISKKQAYISVGQNIKVFSNKAQTVTTTVDDGEVLITENVLQTFYKKGIRMDSIPSEIGKYDVVLTLSSNNYQASQVETTLTITVDVSQISITNTEQVYTIQRNIGVTLGLNNAVFILSFYDAVNNRVFPTIPTNAGNYQIILTFLADDNDGYSDVIVYSEPLVINKYTARIVVASSITTIYTDRRYALNYYTDPYGLNIIREYLAEGEEVYTQEEVYNSGSHKIRLTIDDPNYQGQTIVDYQILPGNLSIATAPAYGQYIYNSDNKPTLLSQGVVDFGTTERDVEGEFNINLNDIKYLNAGVHTVRYTFVASTFGVANPNYNSIQGQTSIIIVKKAIAPENIILGESSGFYVNYDSKYHGIDAYLSEGAVHDSQGTNSDLRLTVYYNGITNLPREKGEYTVRAVITSKNYIGEKVAEQKFIIDYGNPQITTKPNVLIDNFSIGDTITTADITGGRAYLEGTSIQINGRFEVTTTTFNKANINKVQVLFVPDLASLYNSISFEIEVNVRGIDPLGGVVNNQDWTGQIITVSHGGTDYGTVRVVATPKATLVYGVKVSDFVISFETVQAGSSDPKTYLESFGLLSFVPNGNIINVGEKVKISFTPAGSNADTYNIMYGYIDLGLQKANLPYNVVYSLKGFVGKDLTATNRVFDLFVNESILDIDGTLTMYEDSLYEIEYLENAILTPLDENKTIYFSFVTNNYNEVRGAISLEIYEEINSSSIILGTSAKSYDGAPISVGSLNISIINTQLPVDQSAISIRVFDSNGAESEGIDVGTYTVLIYVKDINYYGNASYSFVVNKRNVTNNISLSTTTTTYGTITAPSVLLDGITLASQFKMYYKEANALDSTYTLNLPISAGNYKIKIVVNNEIHEGTKVFDFAVQKLYVRMVANQVYSYVYGSELTPTVAFKYEDSETIISLDYEIYYYSESYTITKNRPYNAGSYKGRVIITDNNYTLHRTLGYAEFNYEITQMVVTVTTLPSAIATVVGEFSYNIKYGQRLNEVRLSGGEATRLGIAINGTFSLSNGSSVLSAGTHNVTVIFTPTNNNYSTAQATISVVIAPADATVSFSLLRASYNGNSRRSIITYSVAPLGVGVRISFINSQGEALTDPINAGNYTVVVTSTNSNYVVSSSLAIDGSNPIFVIEKAEPNVSMIKNPRANSIAVGESLDKSSLISGDDFGLIYYKNFTNYPIPGVFSFVQSSLVYMLAGTYKAQYIFTPKDSNNFAQYRGETDILIRKASATITVSNTTFTYASGFKMPTFTTFPAGLNVKTNVHFVEYDVSRPDYVYNDNQIVESGSYEFFAWVDDPNYLKENVGFSITINKKQLDLDFVDNSGSILTQYLTTYGKRMDAQFVLYDAYNTAGKSGYLLKDKERDGFRVDSNYTISYVSTMGTSVYNKHIAPTERGTYYVTVVLNNKNYTATNTVIYKIERGVIEDISFDQYTLESQVYGGSVVAPIVTTSPSNISYYIVYQGHNRVMPKDAGSYNITVYFDDDNYDKKQVSAMFKIGKKELNIVNIAVKDKVYDGVPTLEINGELKGVLLTDEVKITMSATTLDRAVNSGYHYVTITKYELTGLQANNYTVNKPSYNLQVNIKPNKVVASANTSFITSGTGFNEGTSVEFRELNTSSNKTNVITKAMGTESTVIGFYIKENGAETIIKEQFKVYLAIPEEYLGTDFDVTPAGNLAGQTILPVREGNYITFYASTSGQIVFTKSEFKYTFVVVVVAVIVIIVGIIVLFMLNPLQRASRTQDMSGRKAAIRRIKRGY